MGKRLPKPEPTVTTVMALVEDAACECEALRDELQEWFDKLPENLQEGSKGEALQTAIEGLNEFVDAFGDAPDSAGSVVARFTMTPMKKLNSRRARRDEASAMLSVAKSALEDARGNEACAQFCDEIQEWLDSIDAVEFPGMYS